MNYELAKKLKEAGFPQHVDSDPHGRTYYFIREDNLSFVHQGGLDYPPTLDNAHDEGDIMLSPTLPELIEACIFDKKLRFHLTGENDEWTTTFWVYQNEKEMVGIDGCGKTPEEAVASLWIALNIKK